MILVLVAGTMLPFYCAISGCDDGTWRAGAIKHCQTFRLYFWPLSSIASDFRRSSKGGAFAIELQMAAVDVVCRLMATEVRPSAAATAMLPFNGWASAVLPRVDGCRPLASDGFWRPGCPLGSCHPTVLDCGCLTRRLLCGLCCLPPVVRRPPTVARRLGLLIVCLLCGIFI